MIVDYFEAASIDHPDRCEDAHFLYAQPGRAVVMAVIDGMGGHRHIGADGSLVTGREAAQRVRETLLADLQQLPEDIDASPGGAAELLIRAALNRAHQVLLRDLNRGGQLPMPRRVGAVATVAVVCENGGRVLAAQVGDSRAYLFDGQALTQIFAGEDNIEYLVNLGLIGEADARRVSDVLNTFDGVNEPDATGTIEIGGRRYDLRVAWQWFVDGNNALGILPSNIVMNAIGIDTEDPTPLVTTLDIGAGDTLLLCTDGVYKNLTSAEILEILDSEDPNAATATGRAALARSRDESNGRSTPDDITAVTVRF